MPVCAREVRSSLVSKYKCSAAYRMAQIFSSHCVQVSGGVGITMKKKTFIYGCNLQNRRGVGLNPLLFDQDLPPIIPCLSDERTHLSTTESLLSMSPIFSKWEIEALPSFTSLRDYIIYSFHIHLTCNDLNWEETHCIVSQDLLQEGRDAILRRQT